MLFFVKENRIHKYPIPHTCGATRNNEVLRDTVMHGVEECPYCFRLWPKDESPERPEEKRH